MRLRSDHAAPVPGPEGSRRPEPAHSCQPRVRPHHREAAPACHLALVLDCPSRCLACPSPLLRGNHEPQEDRRTAGREADRMRLYVWEDVLRDYSPGMIVVLAPDLDTAMTMVSEDVRAEMGAKKPTVIDLAADVKPQAWGVYGGG